MLHEAGSREGEASRWPSRSEVRFRPIAALRIECWSEPRPARGRGRRATGCLRALGRAHMRSPGTNSPQDCLCPGSLPRRHPDGWRLLLYLRQPVARRPRPSASGACRHTCLRNRCRKGGRASGRAGVFCAGKGGGGGRRPAPGDTEQSTPARPGAPASNCQSGHRLPRRDEAAGKRTSTNDRNGPKSDVRRPAFQASRAARSAVELLR